MLSTMLVVVLALLLVPISDAEVTCTAAQHIINKCVKCDAPKVVIGTECKIPCAVTKKYVNEGGTWKCVDCGACETCDGGKEVEDNKCAANQYRLTTGAKSCKDCEAGYTCKDQCTKVKCDIKKYITGNTCTDCPKCKKCDGTATAPVECADNHYLKDGVCTACEAGYTCNKCTRVKCDIKKYITGNTCTDCPKCKKCDGTATAPVECADNHYLKDGVCTACGSGGFTCADKCTRTCVAPKVVEGTECKLPCAVTKKYVNEGGTWKCVDCGACETCDGGKEVEDNKCAAGKYRETTGAKSCKDCPTGHTCEDKCTKKNTCDDIKKYITGNTCTDCPECKKCDGTATTPADCADNHYLKDGVCTACGSGGFTCADKCRRTCVAPKVVIGTECKIPCAVTKKYVNEGGTWKCVDCGACETCAGTATVTSNKCAAGQYRETTGAKSCKDCAPGHSCDGCKQVLSAVSCPVNGTFTKKCEDCPTGYECDGTSAFGVPRHTNDTRKPTTKKPAAKDEKKPAVTTPPTMSDAYAWSTALPLLITAFAAIVV